MTAASLVNPSNVLDLIRLLGPGWLIYRAWHLLERKTSVLARRTPLVPWESLELTDFTTSAAPSDPVRLTAELRTDERFLFSPRNRARYRPLLEGFDGGSGWCARRLKEIETGRLRFFGGEPRDCGWPPRWRQSAITGQSADDIRHFSRLSEFDYGDVKAIWEPNRFAFAFDLVRIYWRTGDERCPALFWEAVEDWRLHNPPNAGINWKCGQEAAFRAFAWCFGLWGFLDAAATTPHRLAELVLMLAVTGRRIEANLGYALSQKNNHGISEATGLLTIGLLFPVLRDAGRWEKRGRKLLERQARELIYEDGGFSQYSANYHRVMLDAFVWAIRLAEISGRPLSRDLRRRVARSASYLLDAQDRTTGRVPRYGHDDGARILPLSPCAYEDFRPALQAAAALSDDPLPYLEGPWNEKLLWLFGPESTSRAAASTDRGDAWKESGYGVLRSDDHFAFVRGGRFRHRPSQADLLHVDLWWHGRNVALDPGTFSYNGPDRWASIPLGGTACHNTVTVDKRDQMERVSRFLYLPWAQAPLDCLLRSASGRIGLLELHHDGYERLSDPVVHRRAVVSLGPEHWIVVDRLQAATDHDYRLHWLLADSPMEFDERDGRLVLTVDGRPFAVHVLGSGTLSASVVRAAEESERGWYAPRYGELDAAISLAAIARASDFWFYTILGPGRWSATLADGRLRLAATDWEAEIRRAKDPEGVVSVVEWQGDVTDRLETV